MASTPECTFRIISRCIRASRQAGEFGAIPRQYAPCAYARMVARPVTRKPRPPTRLPGWRSGGTGKRQLPRDTRGCKDNLRPPPAWPCSSGCLAERSLRVVTSSCCRSAAGRSAPAALMTFRILRQSGNNSRNGVGPALPGSARRRSDTRSRPWRPGPCGRWSRWRDGDDVGQARSLGQAGRPGPTYRASRRIQGLALG